MDYKTRPIYLFSARNTTPSTIEVTLGGSDIKKDKEMERGSRKPFTFVIYDKMLQTKSEDTKLTSYWLRIGLAKRTL